MGQKADFFSSGNIPAGDKEAPGHGVCLHSRARTICSELGSAGWDWEVQGHPHIYYLSRRERQSQGPTCILAGKYYLLLFLWTPGPSDQWLV